MVAKRGEEGLYTLCLSVPWDYSQPHKPRLLLWDCVTPAEIGIFTLACKPTSPPKHVFWVQPTQGHSRGMSMKLREGWPFLLPTSRLVCDGSCCGLLNQPDYASILMGSSNKDHALKKWGAFPLLHRQWGRLSRQVVLLQNMCIQNLSAFRE